MQMSPKASAVAMATFPARSMGPVVPAATPGDRITGWRYFPATSMAHSPVSSTCSGLTGLIMVTTRGVRENTSFPPVRMAARVMISSMCPRFPGIPKMHLSDQVRVAYIMARWLSSGATSEGWARIPPLM